MVIGLMLKPNLVKLVMKLALLVMLVLDLLLVNVMFVLLETVYMVNNV